MSWTEEKITTLRDLWEQGLSASQIAAKFGDVTRNAVIGKVHRLGLSGRPTPNRTERPSRTEQRPAPQRPAAAPVRPAAVAATPAPKPQIIHATLPPVVAAPVTAIEPDPEPMVRTSLLAINDRMCKWPLGDPTDQEFHFCGRKAQTGMPYCTEHARMAYQAVSPKRDKRDRDRERERLLRSL